MFDVDLELDAWWEIQQIDAAKAAFCESRHRCPPDMPPCPRCQDRIDEEDFVCYD